MMIGNENYRRRQRLSFFDARKLRRSHWFFEIYIQGSKYNFLELSLNLKWL